MPRLLGAVTLLCAAATSNVTADDPPAVPKEIAVPAGHVPVLTVRAKGVQIYKSVAAKGGKLEWVLEAPLADLIGARGETVGYHFAGPSWEAADGSRLVRDKDAEVKSASAPKPGADIPWLLVRVKADDAPGTLARVVYVQRVLTEGGKPPAADPKREDTRVGVPYKATYIFYAPGK